MHDLPPQAHAATPAGASDAGATFVLEARGLTKRYGGRTVVDGLDLGCRSGRVLGLLGPNGAGKTTTLRMLYGFIEPDGGEIRFEGRPFRSNRSLVKREVGVCTQEDTLDYDFTVEQNLRVYASYFRPRPADLDQRVAGLLRDFELETYRDASPHALSGGYKRRLLIARSVIHRPKALFLDEPTTGLDPSARVAVWELVDRMRSEGMSVILTTHYMDEAERLSDDLVVLSEGKKLAEGTPRTVLGKLLGDHVVVVPRAEPRRDDIVRAATGLGLSPQHVLGEVRLPVDAARIGALVEAFPDVRLSVREPSLDDLFLALSGARHAVDRENGDRT